MKQWFGEKILGLPPLASTNGRGVDDLIIYVHWLMIALFIGWIIYFFYALHRFRRSRNPKADYVGVQNHASNYLELAVAAVEAVLLIFVAAPLWAKAVNQFPPASESTVIQVVAQQFSWNVRYPGPDGKFPKEEQRLVTMDNVFGADPADPDGKDDIQLINEIHVPVNKPVIIYLGSKDVVHSLKIIAVRVCQDAIPGLRVPVWFTPTQIGKYQINCAQLCGNGHSAMSGGYLIVESQEDYDKWLKSKSGGTASFE